MKNSKVTPSSQVDTFLPSFINQQYQDFVNFMSKAAESEERVGFGQDILQNLQKYRDFDTYADKIVQFGVLKGNIGETNNDELTLVDAYGFPQENGVILIDDEVILYQTREENTLYGLQRGASGTTVLPTLRSSGTYVQTQAAAHSNGAKVTNLSVLFLVAILSNIHKSYTPNIEWDRVNEDVNRSSLLQNIKDFFASKGSNFGVASLFKILFGRNNVAVEYPGDKMLKPSLSTWTDTPILRVVPFPEVLSDPNKSYITPDKLIGSELTIRSYNDDKIHGRGVCDYVSRYPFESEVQFELYMNEDSVSGDFPMNPATTLTRQLERTGTNNDLIDVFTVTVESTLGFPEAGVIFIDNEGIYYTAKTQNQFLNCTRGYISVETLHANGSDVYGPYYLVGDTIVDGEEVTSYSWPLNLVKRVNIEKPGLLVQTNTPLIVDGPGLDDPGNQILESLVENLDDDLMTQASTVPNMAWNGEYSDGIDSIYFNDERVLVSTTSFPAYQIGPFSSDDSVGPEMTGINGLYQIPRTQKENTENFGKGSGVIGVAVDGVPYYSNESPDFVVSGGITKINITNQGGGYVNPTVVIDGGATAVATVGNTGRVTDVTLTGNAVYYDVPNARISSGEGEAFSLTFDNYGRLTSIALNSGGQYYNDVPAITLVDASGRGRGALITCEINNGAIQSTTIVSPGIDYNPATTTLKAIPVGSGAEVEVEVERFIFDRPGQVKFNNAWSFDSGNGFLYEDETGERSRFGYVGLPTQLLNRLGDNLQGGYHSPIIGWAFDGNPIYGPFGYANGVDDSEGYQKQFTAYVLRNDRSEAIATGGTGPALQPPSESQYPMGSFIEDYKYDPVAAAIRGGRIKAENDDYIMTELDEYLRYQTEIPGVLDGFNGKVCNTPEFPVELYPDGVYCYFVSTFGEDMAFPYIIGDRFLTRPVSQNLSLIDNGTTIIPQNNIAGTYDDTLVEENTKNINRYRNNILNSTKDEVDVEIVSVSDGSINSVIVEDGNPSNSAVGDIIYFDDANMNGTGATALVSKVDGKNITNSAGYDILTRTISHKQRINLNFDSRSFTFWVGQTITTETGSVGKVINYDYATKFLDIDVTTPRLFQFGDSFYDAKDRFITIPDSPYDITYGSQISGGISTFIGDGVPETDGLSGGDLWWSSYNGRLYIYYNDGDSSQWVTAMPLGMRPFITASDIPAGNTETTSQIFASPQSDTVITMSTTAPSTRSGGAPNQRGDLWWSTHTGNLYIWNSDVVDGMGGSGGTSEWVVTDPTAVVSMEGASDVHQYYTIPTGSPQDYEQAVNVLVSEASPTQLGDGTPLKPGTLWWSPLNGKLFIYYIDEDTSQWVICNPTGSLSSKWGNNTLPSGDGGSNPDHISMLPNSSEDEIVWFESIKHFFVGDIVEFSTGAPGIDTLKELAEILEFGESNQVTLLRGKPALELPNGSEVLNKTRSLFTITTDEPHGLYNGDEVFISGSSNDKLNGKQIVISGGVIHPASATTEITNGSVTTVTVTDPGRNYAEDVYVRFVGGGGVSGYGLAKTTGIDDGGQIYEIDIIGGGVNYTSPPDVIFPDVDTINSFSIYTEETVEGGEDITYATSSPNVFSTINDVELLSGGIGYNDMPRIIGVRKRIADRAAWRIALDGTTIGSVRVSDGGARYTNPGVFIYDITGNGTGATATAVLDGEQVVEIQVTNPGNNYVEPYIRLLETDGKFIATTDDIGQLTAMDVINPGRTISADISLKPELQIDTRVVLQSIGDTPMSFLPGQDVYQGIDTHRFVKAKVVSWDNNRQILTMTQVNGVIRDGEAFYNEFGAAGKVVTNGDVHAVVEVDGISSPRGKFITEESHVSSIDSVIQDSEYYQYFSYVINSPLQQVQYDTFVKQLIHPAGFSMFSNVSVDDGIDSPFLVEDITLSIDSPISLATESGLQIVTESGLAIVGDQEIQEI